MLQTSGAKASKAQAEKAASIMARKNLTLRQRLLPKISQELTQEDQQTPDQVLQGAQGLEQQFQ